MPKRVDHSRQAAARAAAGERRAVARARAAETELVVIRAQLEAVEARHRDLLADRDRVVAGLHSAGRSWGEIARLAGTTRQALMKRLADTPRKQ